MARTVIVYPGNELVLAEAASGVVVITDYPCGPISIQIDIDWLARQFGPIAMESKGRKAQRCAGAIVVKSLEAK